MTSGGGRLRVYLDEDVDVLLARLMATRGLDVECAVDAGMLAKSDSEHLEYATHQRRILVTHNKVDFEQLAVAWWGQRKDHTGIVLAVRRADTYELARRLLPVLNRYDQDGWSNSVLYA
ncbi:MAG: DUF5615 family PIN-like protein [Isosphaeraceae bacterium]